LGDKELRGIGGTRNCDWFLSDSAILLDTAGRYITEDDDREEWLTFLDTLKKHRRRMPINGVIIGFSMQDLLNATPEEMEWHADNIRKRIDELMQRLGIRFPVYMVFTKCDLLDGFVDFFETLNREGREQIWGATYTKEQYESENPASVFEAELQILLNELHHKRLARLSDILKRENRRKVFMFPLQLADMKEKMASLVARIFQVNPYQKDKPICRGFYFTSGTQEGLPIDRAIEAISREFGLPPMPAEYSGPTEIKQYFIKGLLTDVIIPDRDFGGGETTGAARLKRQMRLAIMAGSALLLVLFAIGLGLDYNNSEDEMLALQKAASNLQEVEWGRSDTSSYFYRLSPFSMQISALERGSAVGLGMTRRSTVLEPAYKVYFEKASPFVREVLFRELERRMQRAISSFSEASRDSTYDYLKAYLLLGDQFQRLFEKEERHRDYRNFLGIELGRLLEGRFEGTKKETAFFVEHFGPAAEKGYAQNFSLGDPRYQSVVTRVRNYLNSLPQNEERRIYENLKRQVSGEPKTFAEGPFKASIEVPFVFTKEGSKKFLELLNSDLETDDKEQWVTGRPDQQAATNGKKPQRDLISALKKRYFAEYPERWAQFVKSVQCNPFSSAQEASEQLNSLSNEESSAIISFLTLVAEETRFKDFLRGVMEDLPLVGGGNEGKFDELYDLVHDKRSELDVLLGQLATISSELQGIAQDHSGVTAKEYAKDVIAGKAGLAVAATEVRRLSARKKRPETRDALAGLFNPPLNSVWETVRKEAGAYLNAQWQKQVGEPFSALASYYPFNRSGSDAQPADVVAFFGPGGPMENFAKNELSPFFRTDSWEPLRWQNEGIQLSDDALGALRQAKAISNAIGVGKFDFEVQIQKPVSREKIDKVSLAIGGNEQRWETKRPPAWMKYTWPGEVPAAGALLQLWDDRPLQSDEQVCKECEAEKFNSSFGLFRWINKGRLSQRTRSEYEVHWVFTSKRGKDEIRLTCLLRASGTTNPFAPGFFGFGVPAQLTN
ncbi:type VI secretion system membrane subunit TssM, partial [candidate division KSB1 bacterium]|nr:type VI secretion system membrane subunit TssM [candidate division KSB1 bacterium]